MPQRPTDRIVSLATDVVLTGPWSRACLARVLARIGAGRPWGAWRGDPLNHAAIIWLPWGLVEMINGLHSAIAGAALSKGVFRATVVCDVGPLYEHVACDGRYYTRRHDGAVLAQVEDVQWATLFEIGRLMLECCWRCVIGSPAPASPGGWPAWCARTPPRPPGNATASSSLGSAAAVGSTGRPTGRGCALVPVWCPADPIGAAVGILVASLAGRPSPTEDIATKSPASGIAGHARPSSRRVNRRAVLVTLDRGYT
ncbi:MAG: hypothetical protein M3Q71_16470 [Chloroflexota bacterium]|nr:hypothetical protein [Chloroflexota bacterium]